MTVGGHSGSVQLGYEPPFGGSFQFATASCRTRTYGARHYRPTTTFLTYSRPCSGHSSAANIKAVAMSSAKTTRGTSRASSGTAEGAWLAAPSGVAEVRHQPLMDAGELFVDWVPTPAGRMSTSSRQDTSYAQPYQGRCARSVRRAAFRLGSQRLRCSHRVDDIQSHNLLAVRLIDYRYRFRSRWPNLNRRGRGPLQARNASLRHL